MKMMNITQKKSGTLVSKISFFYICFYVISPWLASFY